MIPVSQPLDVDLTGTALGAILVRLVSTDAEETGSRASESRSV